MDENGYSGRLRKRKRVQGDGSEESLKGLLELTESCGKIVIFSGSGLSANSGMSMFTTKNGLYERARSKFKIQDGMKLFSYPFYKQRRKDLQAFFAQIYSEAQSSRAAPGHVAIAELHRMGRLQRHYTLNIDGLAAAVGMDTWHHEHNPEGSTVEMHGNISYVVCPECHAVEPLTGTVMETMKACQPVMCKACSQEEMRFKVMLYDDEQGDCITPEDVFERLDDDLAVAGAVIWVGISFEQSASTEYFRKVRHMLASHGRLHEVTQVILNPSDEPYFNVISTMSNKEDVKVLDVRATSDDALPCIVQHLHQLGGTSPDSASMEAATAAAKAAAAARRQRTLQQEQEQAAAAQEGHCTPRAGGRRKRQSGSAMGSPAECAAAAAGTHSQPRQAAPVAQPSDAELAAMDSAAAAALSLPAAVQKHLAQKQLQVQHSNGVKAEPAGDEAALQQQTAAMTAAASTGGMQQAGAAAAAPAVAVQQQQQQQQQPDGVQSNSGLQQLLGQLQAVHALQAALAGAAQQQQQPAPAAGPQLLAAASPLLAASTLPPVGAQVPGASAGLAAVSLLLSHPTMLAAVAAASAGSGLGNGTTAAQPAAAATGADVHTGPGGPTDQPALDQEGRSDQEGRAPETGHASPPEPAPAADTCPAGVGAAEGARGEPPGQ